MSAGKDLNSISRDFIANASHELKTPITIIKGFAEALYDNPDLPRATVEMATEKIFNTCGRMTSLIIDLLALSNLDRLSVLEVKKCNIYDLILSCIENVRDLNESTEFVINKDNKNDLLIWVDTSLLELMINNLLTNAIKYCNTEPHIDISIEDHGSDIIIKFADNGIGIPEELQDQIFTRFFTVNKSHSRKLGGSGLGLSLVEQVIHKHHGTITLESTVNKGTIFTVTLPKNLNEQLIQLSQDETNI